MVMDIPVKLSEELGRTRITIKQLLELAQGSVIELDGLAGEPMDILINGYLIAQGEVVVVEVEGTWLLLGVGGAWAQADLPGIVSQPTADGGQQWSLKLQTLLLLTSLAFIPAVLLIQSFFV